MTMRPHDLAEQDIAVIFSVFPNLTKKMQSKGGDSRILLALEAGSRIKHLHSMLDSSTHREEKTFAAAFQQALHFYQL